MKRLASVFFVWVNEESHNPDSFIAGIVVEKWRRECFEIISKDIFVLFVSPPIPVRRDSV